jgi:hypothetical protein
MFMMKNLTNKDTSLTVDKELIIIALEDFEMARWLYCMGRFR